MHAISKMAAGCLQKLLFIFIVVPSVYAMSKVAAGCLLFIFIVVPRVLCHVQDGGWVLTIYIYSCVRCVKLCPRWQLGSGQPLFIFIVVPGVL